MRIIEVSSPSAHDRGRQYGRAAADLIGTAIEYYGRAFELQTGRTWAQILELSVPWEQLVSRDFPELYDGIADGVGVSVRELEVLNCRGEIVYDAESYKLPTSDGAPDGCTSDALLRRPRHPHTQMLLSSAPGPGWQPERVGELRAAFALTEGLP